MKKAEGSGVAALNTFTRSLGEACRENPLLEKWLLAPSLRVGFQWLDAVTRSGQPVVNVRVRTLRHVALDLAGPEMERRGLGLLRGRRAEVVIDRVFARLQGEESGYLAGLSPSAGLTRTLLQAVRDLRLAGLSTGRLRTSAFEVEAKARAVRVLLSEYEEELKAGSLADYAEALRMAADRLRADAAALAPGTILLMPQDAEEELKGLERAFWDTVPAASRRVLPVERGAGRPEGEMTDLALLRWVPASADAPKPRGDGTARMFRAVGAVNEVREVLRRCVEEGIPFDDVEIVHTDVGTYVPLVFELAAGLTAEPGKTLPVTFSDGVPARYSRPGRALAAWVAWVREGFPQATLVRMIRDGLVKAPRTGEEQLSFARLAAVFRSIPVGAGRDQYLPTLDEAFAAERRRVRRREEAGEGEARDESDRRATEQRIAALACLRELVEGLLQDMPPEGAGQRAVLSWAERFLSEQARHDSEQDAYGRRGLLEEIQEMREALDEEENAGGLDVWGWLAGLPDEVRICGQGPRPGCLFVSNLERGAYSGRGHTFIVGLDDTRFPGAGLQDPLLLDRERMTLSKEIPTSGGRLAGRVAAFSRLLARLRGTVTLSFCCRDLADDRDMFPSSVLLSAYRALSGNHEGDQEAMLKWGELAAPASFSPQHAGSCIDMTEWWLWRLCAAGGVKDRRGVIGREFPHLGRGFRARAARESDRFTEYDGYVPEAGRDLDPAQKGGPVLSASRLETLGACPMEYFFRYVLEIEAPEEYETDPTVWLDPAQRGALLHAVFREFMSRLRDKDLVPEFSRDEKLLSRILSSEMEACEAEHPRPSRERPSRERLRREVFEQEKRELWQTARVFLMEEEAQCRESRPAYFEAAIGLPPEGRGTALDMAEPLEIRLPSGRTIRVRGRIDRVDEVPGSRGKQFTVWDYKTGGTWGYEQDDPFRQGRRIQNALYLTLAEACLQRSVSADARVIQFGYFFPGRREHGERIRWASTALAGGRHVLQRLYEMLALGCFPFTDAPEDVRYSDYAPAFGDAETAAEMVKRKLANQADKALDPFRKLRAYGTEKAV